ncbi:hypothetical protein cypCar_00047538 [Cyprinus carpio]|nr:hypothetical protein cypCar_00047538 [Cyprinus carpio]
MFAAGPHFVRCIKPNRSKQPDQLDSKLVMDQLHCRSCTAITLCWKCGSSRLFFKYWHQEELSRLLERLGRAALVIQKNYRARVCRRRYLSLLEEIRRQRQAQREREEREEEERRRQQLEDERKRRLELEQENRRPASPPVPLPRKHKPEPRPRSVLTSVPKAAHLMPVPRPRSKLFEATPFDNRLNRSSDAPLMLHAHR